MKDLVILAEPQAPLPLTAVSPILSQLGVKSYLVGGALRDWLLGRDTADIDIAVSGNALEIGAKVAAALGGRYVLLDEANMLSRVVMVCEEHRWQVDFGTLRGSIEQDLAQRDFTIDAMAVDLSQIGAEQTGIELVDPFQGWSDLRQGVIRAVTETAFASDAIRLLRAVRLAAELGFTIDRETEALIRRYSHLVGSVAGERVREEWLRLLAVSGTGGLWHYLDELGLVTAMIPELAQAKGITQPKEHFWDIFDHSLETVDTVDFMLRRGEWKHASGEVLAAVPWSAALARHFDLPVSHGSNRRVLLKLAALLHDVAKPQTRTIDANGRIRFLGHAKEGAVMVANILERLRFSTKEIRLAEILVRYHLRPTQMSNDGLPTRRAIYRYFRDTGEAGIDILFLSLADHLATRGPHLDPDEWQEHIQVVEYVLRQRFQEERLVTPPKLIDGHDLIKIFGMSPGRRVGELLEAVREAQAAGEVSTREDALSFLNSLLKSPPDSVYSKEEAKGENQDGLPSKRLHDNCLR